MTRRGALLEAGLATIVLAITLAMLNGHGFGTPGPGTRDLDTLGALLGAATAAPLAARRAAPLAVYLVVAAASTALVGLAYPLDVPLGALVAVYSLASARGGDARPVWRVASVGAAAAFVPAAAVALLARGVPISEIAAPMLFWAVVFAGIWIMADRDRLRRELIEDLAERARRAEHEAERERRLAVVEERLRIARDLHDSAGHAINVILVQAGAARLLQQRDPEGSARAIAAIEQVSRDTIGEIDRLVRALRADEAPEPPTPADPSALEDIVRRYRAAGLVVGTDVGGERRALSGGVAGAAYRILQEGLTNAARHGRGSARVELRFEPRELSITITNPMMEQRPARNGGHGIVGMRERAAMLGGTLEAGVRQGVFRMCARLPYDSLTS